MTRTNRIRRKDELPAPSESPGDAAIAGLGLSVRVVNFLEERGCLWLHELFAYHPDEVANWPGFGSHIRQLVAAALKARGMAVPYHWRKPAGSPGPRCRGLYE